MRITKALFTLLLTACVALSATSASALSSTNTDSNANHHGLTDTSAPGDLHGQDLIEALRLSYDLTPKEAADLEAFVTAVEEEETHSDARFTAGDPSTMAVRGKWTEWYHCAKKISKKSVFRCVVVDILGAQAFDLSMEALVELVTEKAPRALKKFFEGAMKGAAQLAMGDLWYEYSGWCILSKTHPQCSRV